MPKIPDSILQKKSTSKENNTIYKRHELKGFQSQTSASEQWYNRVVPQIEAGGKLVALQWEQKVEALRSF